MTTDFWIARHMITGELYQVAVPARGLLYSEEIVKEVMSHHLYGVTEFDLVKLENHGLVVEPLFRAS